MSGIQNSPSRNMVFISHANPEDNEFTRWLSLQLAREGYAVWCDLTKLLGGEDFWSDIQKAIRERTAKFVYVLSRASNVKAGALDELHVAKNAQRSLQLADFIVPVAIDDLPPREYDIRIARITSVSCANGWASALAQLLEKLAEDGVPKDSRFTPGAVTNWWRSEIDQRFSIQNQPETLATNFFPLRSDPVVQFHELSRIGIGVLEVPTALPFAAVQHGPYLATFVGPERVTAALPADLSLGQTHQFALALPESQWKPRWTPRERNDLLTRLLRQAWELMLARRNLSTYQFANGSIAFYFTKGMVEGDELRFARLNGATLGRRQIMGYHTMKGPDGKVSGLRHWHFALQAKAVLWPQPGYLMKAHVLFSDDGETIWTSKDRLHAARRSQCRLWWNDSWRDRILATMAWLGADSSAVVLDGEASPQLEVSVVPTQLTAPVTYDESRLSEQGETSVPPGDEEEFGDEDNPDESVDGDNGTSETEVGE